eukprot:COSAG05_NODE_20448_length_279_cov_0.811111_1_plen_51_part_10
MRRNRKAGREEPVPTEVNKKGLVLPSLRFVTLVITSVTKRRPHTSTYLPRS